MGTRKKDFPCISCNSHVKKNDKAVQCSLCDLWVHQACEGMSSETYGVLVAQARDQGGTYWSCKSCRSYAAKFDKRMREIDRRLQDVEVKVDKSDAAVSDLKKEVSEMRISVDAVVNSEAKIQDNTATAVFSEMRERDQEKQRRDSWVLGAPRYH